MNTTNATKTGNLDQFAFQIAPSRALVTLLQNLTSLYEEIGLPAHIAKEAALADLECSITVLAMAA